MKKLKLKIQNLKNPTILSHHETKNILGGEEGSGGSYCSLMSTCQLYVRELGQTFTGRCEIAWENGNCRCRVIINNNVYWTDPGTTSECWV